MAHDQGKQLGVAKESKGRDQGKQGAWPGKQLGVVRGNKDVGQEEHMANTNRDRAMCSDTKQTLNRDKTDKTVRTGS